MVKLGLELVLKIEEQNMLFASRLIDGHSNVIFKYLKELILESFGCNSDWWKFERRYLCC
jgi:hypothetical protein